MGSDRLGMPAVNRDGVRDPKPQTWGTYYRSADRTLSDLPLRCLHHFTVVFQESLFSVLKFGLTQGRRELTD